MPSYRGKDLTSYDLVKTLALILMVIDHIGYFFFPQTEILRVLGRACVPIWCFLIGYSNTREIKNSLIIWAGLLLLSNFIFGGFIFPLNILFSFMIARLVLDALAQRMFQGWQPLLAITLILVVLISPSMRGVEYGTLVLLLALCGVMARRSPTLSLNIHIQRLFIFSVFVTFILAQIWVFNFTVEGSKLCAIAVGATSLMMVIFRPAEFPTSSHRLTALLAGPFQIMGRYTLEIYALHLIIFKAVAAYYGLAGHGFLDWKWSM